jgi:hypothetical protein
MRGHNLEEGQSHLRDSDTQSYHQAPEGSKYCSPYAQRCKEACCDKYGECPEYSGRSCRYYYGAGKIPDSATGASDGDSENSAASKNNAPSQEEGTPSTKARRTTRITRIKKRSTRSQTISGSRRTEPEETPDNK